MATVITEEEECASKGRAREAPGPLKLWKPSNYHREKHDRRAYICSFWSCYVHQFGHINAAYSLAVEAIKYFLLCYSDPPDWRNEEDYLLEAIVRIAQWRRTDLLPNISKPKAETVGQKLFNVLSKNLPRMIHTNHNVSKRVLILLLRKSSCITNSGWLLNFQFSAAQSPISFNWLLSNSLYDREVVYQLLVHGMRVCKEEVDLALNMLQDEEKKVFQKLVENVKKPSNFGRDISPEAVIKHEKYCFAAILCVNSTIDRTVKFLDIMSSSRVTGTGVQKFSRLLTANLRSKLFYKMCSNEEAKMCSIVLESGNLDNNVILKVFKIYANFILCDERFNLFESLLRHSPEVSAMLKVVLEDKNESIHITTTYKTVLRLLREGGDVTLVRLAYTGGTPIHGAVQICLRRGKTCLLSTVCHLFKEQYPRVKTFLDSNKSSPYHLLAKDERKVTAELCNILIDFKLINPTLRDKCNKSALDYARERKFTCIGVFQRAIDSWKGIKTVDVIPSLTHEKHKFHPEVKIPSTDLSHQSHNKDIVSVTVDLNNELEGAEKSKNVEKNLEILNPAESELLNVAVNRKEELDMPDTGKCIEETSSSPDYDVPCRPIKELLHSLLKMPPGYFIDSIEAEEESGDEYEYEDNKAKDEEYANTANENGMLLPVPLEPIVDDSIDFSSLDWEIFISKQASDFMRAKKTSAKVVRDIKNKLHRIGSGDRSDTICHRQIKPLEYKLFETYLYRSARIIWQEDIQYSELKSCPENGELIYSDVVRIIWITLKHSDNQLKDVLQRIKSALSKSKNTNGKKLIQLGTSKNNFGNSFRRPRLFVPADENQQQSKSLEKSCPIPNLYGGEFSVMQYHPFADFLNSLLNKDPSIRECPCRIVMSQQEHEIIRLPYGKEAIILCGRSGTGKTTTCIYRMWNEFVAFWKRYTGNLKRETLDEEMQQDKEENCKDYLKQVFITKSPVLCAQVKKEFDKLLKSSEHFMDTRLFDRNTLKKVEKLSTCNPKKFPLFLTSRNLLYNLDASLQGETFFPRDPDTGELEIVIDFCDYNEDIDPERLFEDIDHEDNEDKGDNAQTVKKIHGIEVNADYFCNVIWEEISANDYSNMDPLLVWTEIQSFIKGTVDAIESKKGYLSRESYQSIGKHTAPSFTDEKRDACYNCFEKYCKYVAKQKDNGIFCFDECDLIFNIYKRLQNHGHGNPLNWHLDHFYIDEVQDFTQAEMRLLLKCCRNPNGTFCTGDVAQSIMKGVFFRFEDLRSQFHKYKVAQKQVPVPEVLTLTENFRSHSGVLELAQSIVDILKKCFTAYFQDSNLPRENAVFKGPKPVLLKTDSTNELAGIMLGSEGKASLPHELGAHQAIIVRSEKDRGNLPESLKNGIVLTVLEAKGLEFNDVLLYNFFSSSKIKDHWRFLYNIAGNEEELATKVKTALNIERLHQLRIDEKQEERLKSLSAELKHLYTAITRARMNLWIYDEGEERKPFFYYCLINGLARLVTTDNQSADSDNLMFAAPSPDEQWLRQGDYYFSMGKWELAMKCYGRANVHHKMFLTNAYKHVQEASYSKCTKDEAKMLHKEAARLFLSADESKHCTEYIQKAISCFQRAGCHANAAVLLEKMQDLQRALREWVKDGNTAKVSELREALGDYSGAVRCIADNGDYGGALLKAADFERSGKVLEEDVTSQQMAWIYLREKKGKSIDSAEALQYISEGSVRATLLRENERLEDAAEEFLKGGHHDQAYRILEAQGLFEKGYEVAEDEKMKAKFLLYHTTFLLVESKWVKTQKIAENLKNLERLPFRYFQARSQLLTALVERSEPSLRKAIKNFKEFDCLPGEVAAYYCCKYLNIQTHPYEQDLRTSKAANEIVESISACGTISSCTAKQRLIYQEVLRVHDLEHQDSNKYFISPFLLKNNVCQPLQELANTSTSKTDEDGMLVLEKVEVDKILIRYYSETSVTVLKGSSYFTEEIPSKLITSQFHRDIRNKHFTTSYVSIDLKAYFRNIKNLIEFCLLANEQSKTLSEETLLVLFSSVVAFYFNIKKNNMYFLKCSRLVTAFFNRLAIKTLKDSEINIEGYFISFRLLTVFCGKHYAKQKVLEAIKTLKSKYNFLHERSGKNMHIFNGWLVTDARIAGGDVINGVWSIYNFFLSRIAHLDNDNRREAISVSSITYILSVFSTALFSMLFFGNHTSTCFLLPNMYLNLVQNFDTFSSTSNPLLEICLRQSQACDGRKLSHAFRQLELFLTFLLGEDENHYNILHTALDTDSCILDGSALYCLILCLVLAGNLYNHYSLINSQSEIETLRKKLVSIHKIVRATTKISSHQKAFVTTAINELSRAKNSADVFKLISCLLETHHQHSWLVTPTVRGDSINYELVYTIHYPRCQMRALVIMEAPESTCTNEPQTTIKRSTSEEQEALQTDDVEMEKDDENETVEAEKDELIVDNFCKVCGEFGETEGEYSGDQVIDNKSHLKSAEHLQNASEYKNYSEMKMKIEQECRNLMGEIEKLSEEKGFLKLEALTSKLKYIIESIRKLDTEMIKLLEWTDGVVKLEQWSVETTRYYDEYCLLKEKHEKHKITSEFKTEENEDDILPEVTSTLKLKKKTRKKRKAT